MVNSQTMFVLSLSPISDKKIKNSKTCKSYSLTKEVGIDYLFCLHIKINTAVSLV